MSIRIAVVGRRDPGDPDHRAIDDVLARLPPEVEAPWIAPDDAARITGADGIWLAPRPPWTGGPVLPDDRAVVEAASWADRIGLPVLAPRPGDRPVVGGALDPHVVAFLDRAAGRARVRLAWEAEQARAQQVAQAQASPRSYVHQLRGPRMRWWRPIAAFALFVLTYVAIALAVTVPFALAGTLTSGTSAFEVSAANNLYLNLSLAALVPAVLLTSRLVYGRSPGRVFSVAGRLRWGWLARSMVVVTPLWLAYLTLSWFLSGQEVLARPKDWLALSVVTLLTTPLQSAGEEVAFRGGFTQWIGSWMRSPVVAFGVAGVVTTGLFVAAHGSFDPWTMIDIGSLGVAAAVLAWRTGGIEAGIALHVVNNLLITFAGIGLGGLEQSYVDADTTGDPWSALTSVVVMTLATLLLLRQAKRSGLTPEGRLAPAIG